MSHDSVCKDDKNVSLKAKTWHNQLTGGVKEPHDSGISFLMASLPSELMMHSLMVFCIKGSYRQQENKLCKRSLWREETSKAALL